jgi:hypothetical protein
MKMNNVSARLDLNTRMMIGLLYEGIDRTFKHQSHLCDIRQPFNSSLRIAHDVYFAYPYANKFKWRMSALSEMYFEGSCRSSAITSPKTPQCLRIRSTWTNQSVYRTCQTERLVAGRITRWRYYICLRTPVVGQSSGPANKSKFPSGSFTMKFVAPHGCFFSV